MRAAPPFGYHRAGNGDDRARKHARLEQSQRTRVPALETDQHSGVERDAARGASDTLFFLLTRFHDAPSFFNQRLTSRSGISTPAPSSASARSRASCRASSSTNS